MTTDDPDNLTLVMLRRIDGKIDRIAEDVRELKLRMSSVETQVGVIHARIDRIEGRLERIEPLRPGG
jgi:predicted  nucleic acid-binding Zn-ribbon protein